MEVLRLKDDSTETLAEVRADAAACLAELREAKEASANSINLSRRPAARNVVLEALDRAERSSSSPRPRAEPRDSGIFVRKPDVTVGDDGSVAVAGTVRNANSQPIEGFLAVILSVDGAEVDSRSLSMTIPGNTVGSYDTLFPVVVERGNMRVTVSWDKER